MLVLPLSTGTLRKANEMDDVLLKQPADAVTPTGQELETRFLVPLYQANFITSNCDIQLAEAFSLILSWGKNEGGTNGR